MEKARFGWFVRDVSFYKRIALIALPLAGQSIISFSVGLADNLMVAHLGENSIGGIYIANQIQSVLHMLVMGLGAALVILAAQYFGKGDTRSVKIIWSFAMKIAFGVGLTLFLLMMFAGRPIFGMLSNSEPVVAESLVYMSWLKWSFMIFAVTNVLLATMRCAGSVNIGIVTSLVAFLSNLLFNYIFIYGNFGAPEMKVAGAAIATLISRCFECAVVIIYVLTRDMKIRIRPRDILLKGGRLTFDFFRYGTPVILGDLLWGFGMVAQAAIIGRLGEPVIAASALVGNMFQLFSIFVYGTASAGSLTVGQAIGKNDFDTAKKYTKTLQLVYLAVGVMSSLVMFALRYAILSFPSFQTLEPQTMRHCVEFLSVLCVTLVGTSYQMASLQIVRAGGATHFVLMNDLIFVWLVIVPMALIAHNVFAAPPWVVFFCLKSDQLWKCGVAVVKVNRFRWMKNLTREAGAN